MIAFNNDLSAHTLSIAWKTHLDSPTGLLTAAGETEKALVPPGESVEPTITVPCPGTGSAWLPLYFVISTKVDGAVAFSENHYVFKIKNASARPTLPFRQPAGG